MEPEEIKLEIEEVNEEKESGKQSFQNFPEILNRGKIWTGFVAFIAYILDKEVIWFFFLLSLVKYCYMYHDIFLKK